LQVDTRGYKGRVRKSALVITNDTQAVNRTISLEAAVRPLLEAEPSHRFYIPTQVGRPAKMSIVLTSNLPEPLKITALDHNFGPAAQVEWEAVEAGRSYRVTLSTQAEREMRLAGQIILHLEGTNTETYRLTGFIEVRAKETGIKE